MNKILNLILILILGFNSLQATIILELPKGTDPEKTILTLSWVNNNENIDLTGLKKTIPGVFAGERQDYSERAGMYKIIIDKLPKEDKDNITLKLSLKDSNIKFPSVTIPIGIGDGKINPEGRVSFVTKCDKQDYELAKSNDKKSSLCIDDFYKP